MLAAGLLVNFAHTVAELRAQRATGPNWSFPSRVFSAGVPLAPGRVASLDDLRSELLAREYREVGGPPAKPGTFARNASGFTIFLRGFLDERDPEGGGGPERVFVGLDQGRITTVRRLGGIAGAPPPDLAHPPRLEPVLVSMLFDEERMWRTDVSIARIPQPVRDAIVVSEDRRFYTHDGIDLRGAVRALTVDLRSGDVKQGGSTITQQLARGLFLGRERTWSRKLEEVPLAVGLEFLLSKDQILEMYLNSVYWGQAEGFAVGGIAEAARWYFDAPIESLTVVQGATLAAMIPGPNVFNPFKDPVTVRERRDAVLEAMVETKHLDAADAERLEALPLGVKKGEAPTERFPWYSGYVRDALEDRLPHHAATHEGLAIFTTMDLAWQEIAEEAIGSGLAILDPRGGPRGLQGAFVAIDPGSGSVLAMVGGRTSRAGAFNRAYQAHRQTGSAIKPIVYAAGLASGLTPATTVPDTQRTFGSGRSAWRPQNFDGTYHREVTLAHALEASLNLATTSLVERIGPHTVADLAEEFGLAGLKPVMSIGLGSNETTLLQLTGAFTVFAAGGMHRDPTPLRIAVDRTGRAVVTPSHAAASAIAPGIAALMTGLLENVTKYGVARALHGTYGFDRPVAGKTGTTNDDRDAWFVGFTPEVVAGIWVGYDLPRSVGDQAAHTALPLWARAVGRMLRGFAPAPFPADSGLSWVAIDPWRGCLADSTTHGGAEITPFLFGTSPTLACAMAGPYEDWEYGSADSSGDSTDSSFASDSLWRAQPDTATLPRPDTLEVPSPAPEPDTTHAPPPHGTRGGDAGAPPARPKTTIVRGTDRERERSR